jgi:hypothetical protein
VLIMTTETFLLHAKTYLDAEVSPATGDQVKYEAQRSEEERKQHMTMLPELTERRAAAEARSSMIRRDIDQIARSYKFRQASLRRVGQCIGVLSCATWECGLRNFAIPQGLEDGGKLRWASALSPWPSYVLARWWLALHHRLPWSLMDFLTDAHRRGILRQAGAVYQFRHIELQRRLAARL